MSNLLNVEETAQILGLEIGIVYKMVCQKRIPYTKIGGRLRFSKEKLQEWIEQNSYEPLSSMN